MVKIAKSKILILATDGFEQSELEVPLTNLRGEGALVHVGAPAGRKMATGARLFPSMSN